MAPPRRKTRVTKKEVIAVREEMKIPSYQRKKNIKLGKWSEIDPGFTINLKLKANKSCYSDDVYYGSYVDVSNWCEKGWYPILMNIQLNDMKELITTHGMDKFMAAVENSLNTTKENGKPKFGNVVLLEWLTDNSQNDDESKRFISIKAKTNKKNITGFFASRKGELVIICKNDDQESSAESE